MEWGGSRTSSAEHARKESELPPLRGVTLDA